MDETTALLKLKERMRQIYSRSSGSQPELVPADNWPKDYSLFLSQIGGGTIGDMYFEIYDKPLCARDIFGDAVSVALSNVLIVGDDFNGNCVALDPAQNWDVVEIAKSSQKLERLAASFYEFLFNDCV